MTKRKSVVAGTLVLFALSFGVGVFFLMRKAATMEKSAFPTMIGTTAPESVLKDIEGRIVTLSSFRGKPVVAILWASWCSFCKDELSNYVAVQREFLADDREIVFLAIHRGEPAEQVGDITRESGPDVSPVILLSDRDDALYRALNGFTMPETLFIDQNGVIRGHYRQSMSAEELRRRIQNVFYL